MILCSVLLLHYFFFGYIHTSKSSPNKSTNNPWVWKQIEHFEIDIVWYCKTNPTQKGFVPEGRIWMDFYLYIYVVWNYGSMNRLKHVANGDQVGRHNINMVRHICFGTEWFVALFFFISGTFFPSYTFVWRSAVHLVYTAVAIYKPIDKG